MQANRFPNSNSGNGNASALRAAAGHFQCKTVGADSTVLVDIQRPVLPIIFKVNGKKECVHAFCLFSFFPLILKKISPLSYNFRV